MTTTTTTASVPDRDFLLALAQTDAFTPLPATSLEAVLSSPPFVPVPGTFNARDLGLVPGSPIRSGRLYRTGVFSSSSSSPSSSSSTADSRSELEPGLGLGVGRMFDLRTAGERARRPELVVDGVEAVWIAPDEGGEAAPGLKDFEEGEGEKGMVRMYLGVMRLYRRGIRRLLEQVGEGWDRGAVLFHCNAGRDRTGVVAAILLSLAGASGETIALDYMLSRIGIEPAKDQLLAYVTKGPMAASLDSPGFRNMANLRLSCWEAFVRAVDAEYGGFEGYVRATLGFSEEEVAKIKNNLVLPN
ncbi:protein-tyrosine phosphatase-like protein [Corynascus novoguineensis]|uniref:Protein-tyrosine phosphatase-like protein n=1 Tax=Corynascus novoguineensis TaxID=1126955 RepID=A0AAN7CX85_9PEZI|nr:protein-tyrosine phosphatase-like protein [Corynascus novoguineensis]